MKWPWGPREPAERPVPKRESALGRRAVDVDGDPTTVITGDHNIIVGDVSRPTTPKAPVSVYEADIRILAAAHFRGWETGLAEMRALALGEDPHGPSYWRWRTGAGWPRRGRAGRR